MPSLRLLCELLLRATLWFPLAVAGCFLVAAYFSLPLLLVVYSLWVSPWYWLTVAAWALSCLVLGLLLRRIGIR